MIDEEGPDHDKCFQVCVQIGFRRFASCWGKSKKQAEQEAALGTLLELGIARKSENDEILLQEPEELLAEDVLKLIDAQPVYEPQD